MVGINQIEPAYTRKWFPASITQRSRFQGHLNVDMDTIINVLTSNNVNIATLKVFCGEQMDFNKEPPRPRYATFAGKLYKDLCHSIFHPLTQVVIVRIGISKTLRNFWSILRPTPSGVKVARFARWSLKICLTLFSMSDLIRAPCSIINPNATMI